MLNVFYNSELRTKAKGCLCYAPSYSMHIAQNGIVSACSLSRFSPLGVYPKQSLEEIWWSKTAQHMREDMSKHTFPVGCGVCNADFASGNYDNIRAKHYDKYASDSFTKLNKSLKNKLLKGRFGEYPKVISFELSNTCNLECVSCIGLLSSSIRKNREKLPPIPQLFKREFFSELIPFITNLQEAKFYGGEPFLIPLYLDIWEHIAETNPNCCVYVTTNGTVFNSRVESILKRLKNVELIISLDGISKHTFERIRVNARYEEVIENLYKFKSIMEGNGRKLTISPTYMRYNWQEYPKLLDFACKESILFQTNLLLTPPELSLSSMTAQELNNVFQMWQNYPPQLGMNEEINRYNINFFESAIQQVKIWLDEKNRLEGTDWYNVLKSLSVSSETEQYVIDVLVDNLGSIKDPALMLRSGRIALLKRTDELLSILKMVAKLSTSDNLDNYIKILDELVVFLTGDESTDAYRIQLNRKLYQPCVIVQLTEMIHSCLSLEELLNYLDNVTADNQNDENFSSYYGT